MLVTISDIEMCGIFIYFDLFEDFFFLFRLCLLIYYVRLLFFRKIKKFISYD